MTSTQDESEKFRRWEESLEAALVFDDAPACHARMVQDIGLDGARRVSLALALKWVTLTHRQGWVTA